MKKILALLLLFINPTLAAEKADFILLKNPPTLIILDKYEQQSTSSFLPGSPFQILDKKHVLSDGITTVLKCQFKQQIFFIIPLEEAYEYINKTSVIDDTVHLTREAVTLHLPNGDQTNLKEGTALTRFFLKGERTYAFADKFGWVRLRSRDWKPLVQIAVTAETFPDKLRKRIEARIESTNKSYFDLFTFFNKKYQKDIKALHWQVTYTDEKILLQLKPANQAKKLNPSSRVLREELSKIILDYPLQCTQNDSQIIISKRP